MVEGLGVSQIFALVPSYLRQMGVPQDERLAFVGLFSALIFVVGMPLVPLWGVWADKYSRKAVIVRSALIEAVGLRDAHLTEIGREQGEDLAYAEPLDQRRHPEDADEDPPILPRARGFGAGFGGRFVARLGRSCAGHPPSLSDPDVARRSLGPGPGRWRGARKRPKELVGGPAVRRVRWL